LAQKLNQVKNMELAIFGRVSMLRVVCPVCGCASLVVDGKTLCCDEKIEPISPVRAISVVNVPPLRRRHPEQAAQLALLDEQGYRCFYCGADLREAEIHFDHLLPYSYCGRNEGSSFVASCARCNQKKSNKL
jgi:5-methylcytosine-specific restriction endonuclease McrA